MDFVRGVIYALYVRDFISRYFPEDLPAELVRKRASGILRKALS
jgi:hypothetical protein